LQLIKVEKSQHMGRGEITNDCIYGTGVGMIDFGLKLSICL